MYDSAITAEDFVASVASTVNIGCSLPEEFYLDVLSRLEQLLYSEHIREERLLFATDSPWQDIAAERARLATLGLTPAEEEAIACRNACALLGIPCR